jgi:hypothetical protein
MCDHFKGAKGCSVGYAEGEISLRYHDTVVARFYFDTGQLILNHGGWLTYYTKERINRFMNVLDLSAGLYQHRKVWTVSYTPGKNYSDERIEERWDHIDVGSCPELAINTGVTCSP